MALEALKRNGHNLDLIDCETAGKFDIPVIRAENAPKRMDWISFNCVNTDSGRYSHGVHFFIDDYLFQRTWNDPVRYAELLREYKAVLSADFSMFTDYPKSVQIYNHWRKHLLAAYWQKRGMTVYPSICWSDHESYDWCFDGEPEHATVAVSSVGTQKNPRARELFADGYREMIDRLAPEKILFFGDVPKGCEGNIEQYDPFYKAVHSRRGTVVFCGDQR